MINYFEKIKREKEILKNLDHKNIIKFIAFFQNSNLSSHVILMEYFNSILLEDFIKDIIYNNSIKMFIISQIFDAISYFHRKSIIHRDLNCKNVLINPKTYEIKIIDFGVARTCDEDEEVVSPQGNLGYRMPPEFEFSSNPFLMDFWSASLVCLSVVATKKISTRFATKLLKIKDQTNILFKENSSLISLLVKIDQTLKTLGKKENFDEEKTIYRLKEIFEMHKN